MAKSRPGKKAKPAQPPLPGMHPPEPSGTVRVLPMQLQIGDRMTDSTGEWEVIGRSYTTAGGKNSHVRVQRVDNLGVTETRMWGSYEKEAPLEDLRAMAGTHMPRLPEPYKEDWNTELEHEYLNWGIANPIPAQTLQAVLEFYTDLSIVSSDQSIEWAEAEFHRAFADRLTKPQRDILLRFWKEDVLGDGGSDTTDEGGES